MVERAPLIELREYLKNHANFDLNSHAARAVKYISSLVRIEYLILKSEERDRPSERLKFMRRHALRFIDIAQRSEGGKEYRSLSELALAAMQVSPKIRKARIGQVLDIFNDIPGKKYHVGRVGREYEDYRFNITDN